MKNISWEDNKMNVLIPMAGAGKEGDPAKKDDKVKGKEQATEKKKPEKK